MCSRSSNRTLVIGRVAGHRGNAGEITIRVASGQAERWLHLEHVGLAAREEDGRATDYDVDGARAYRDRLVLKLAGVDTGDAAARLRGRWVRATRDQVPALPDGEYYQAWLIGLGVLEGTETLGRVVDVLDTPGPDLLVVRDDRGGELMIPFVASIVTAVDEDAGCVRVRLPDGLRELAGGEDGS